MEDKRGTSKAAFMRRSRRAWLLWEQVKHKARSAKRRPTAADIRVAEEL